MKRTAYDRDDLRQTHDGLKAPCPVCRRPRFLYLLMKRECRCGAGPYTVVLRREDG